MINFNLLSTANYSVARFSILLKTEDSQALPYLDIVGHPTIGIGFDLTVKSSLDAVLNELALKLLETGNASKYTALRNVISASYSSSTALRTAINNKMAEFYAADPTIPATLDFASDSDPKIKLVLDNLVKVYETRVDNWLAGIPDSAERAVLVSLSYNGGLGSNLKTYIDNGDRAAAWYEIRYATNGGASASVGIANRRYVESERFGLFSDPSFPQFPTQQEAYQAAVMYTINRSSILAYEAKYSPSVAATTKAELGIQDIYREMMPAIEYLKAEYGVSVLIEEVQMLAPIGGLNSNLNGDGTAYDNSNNDQDLLIGNSAANTLNGGQGNDVLVGNGGNDTLIGGAGADIINGGLGIDTVSYASSAYLVNVSLARTTAQFGGDAAGDILSNIENIIGSFSNDTLTGNSSANILTGGKGRDILTGGDGNDVLDGGADFDTIKYADSVRLLNVKIVETVAPIAPTGGYGETDIIVNVEQIDATAGADTLDISLLTNTAVQTINTGGGNDTVSVHGSAVGFRPVIDLGAGNDILGAAPRGSIVYGGSGNDSFELGQESAWAKLISVNDNAVNNNKPAIDSEFYQIKVA